MKALITRVLRAIHRAQPAAPNTPAADVPVTATSKPVTDLKPNVLTFDACIAHVRRWIKHIEAYHSASNMRILSIRNQQAFLLLLCLDDDVSARVSRLSTITTPIFPPFNIEPCFSLIEKMYVFRFICSCAVDCKSSFYEVSSKFQEEVAV